MRGRPRKHPDQLQDRRPSRQRATVVLDMGGGVTWTVPANSLAALTYTGPRAPWREPAPSKKAVIARGKPRDEKGRFLPTSPAVPGDRRPARPRPAKDTDQLAALLAADGAEAMADLAASAVSLDELATALDAAAAITPDLDPESAQRLADLAASRR